MVALNELSMFKQLFVSALFLGLVFSVAGASGEWTSDNATDTFSVSPGNVSESVSVNRYGMTLENVSLKYTDNLSTSTRSFETVVSGNVSEIVDFPSRVTLFHNESSSFPLVGNVGESQGFGSYTGNLSLTATGNSNFTESVSLNISVFDDIDPVIDSASVNNVMSTETVSWSVEASDNLNVSGVEGSVLQEVEVSRGNSTVTENETVDQVSFDSMDGMYNYTFSDSDSIGQYYLNLSVVDTSGNTVSSVYPFRVEGLESISVLEENFVFDTIRPKEDTSVDLVNSRIEGKNLSFRLENLSYGGNATVDIGVRPPNGDSPEILDAGETREFDQKGVYELVLLHSGSDEVKGAHRVTGEVSVVRPDQHVGRSRVSSVFTGTVKNLDKPPELCQRFSEFDGCIGYSLDSVRSLFDDRYNISDSESKDFAYLIGRVPTSEVEGSDSWGDETSLTIGEYNETLSENQDLKEEVDRKVGSIWKTMF